MLEGCFQNSGRISNDAFATYRFFLQPRRDEPFKRRETRTLALRDFDVLGSQSLPSFVLSRQEFVAPLGC